ncbi:MAG: hypothetical protein R3F59_31330 [Myxococcota bacterium]
MLAFAAWLGVWPGLEASACAGSGDFDVSFAGCTEFAGIGFVPWANAEPLVPAGYTLAGDGTSAILVVRVADCTDVSVDGHRPRAGTLSQIGLTVVGDGGADIENYTLWYVTDNALLHAKLTAAGVDTVHDNHMLYDFVPDGTGSGTLDIEVTPPQAPDHEVHGTADVPVSAPTTFVARWWQEGPHGTVLMESTFPDIQFSTADMTLTTPAGSELADLIGATSMTFSLLDSYNAVGSADMTVTVD